MATSQESRYRRHQRRWKEIKSNPDLLNEYREFSKKSYKKYIEKNREYLRNYAKELRELDLELGNCTACHKPKDSIKYKLCSKCREKGREYQRKLSRKSKHLNS